MLKIFLFVDNRDILLVKMWVATGLLICIFLSMYSDSSGKYRVFQMLQLILFTLLERLVIRVLVCSLMLLLLSLILLLLFCGDGMLM